MSYLHLNNVIAINKFVYNNRIKAAEIAKEEGLLSNSSAFRKKNRFKSKEEIKREEEQILRKIIEEKLDIKGSYSKPTYKDILWVQLVLFPFKIMHYIYFHINWFYKYVLLKQPYCEEAKKYLIRKHMGLSEAQYKMLEEEDQEEFLRLQLWIKSNYKQWKEKKDDETRAKLAESSSYKRYRRWLRKGGPGTITFIDE